MQRELAPKGIAPPAANYAHAILSEDVSRLLHTSGVVPTRPDGTVPDEIGDQAEVIWQTIRRLLDEAEMSTADIVSVTTYVVAELVGTDALAIVMKARDRALDGQLAASTLVIVPVLAQPSWKLEIAVVAAA